MSSTSLQPYPQVNAGDSEHAAPRRSAIITALGYVRQHWAAFLLCSVGVLVPCFWHHHIQANDLGSHMYNAWLAQLIRAGKAPGLYIVPQYSNVLFDRLLDVLFPAFGELAAERIAVSFCVLVFFWGAFSLCAAATDRACWDLLPLLAMSSYGLMFSMGFMNLYLSVGFSLFALAIIWRGYRWDFVLLPPLLAVIWLSHSLGAAGAVGVGAYLVLARILPRSWSRFLAVAALAVYWLVRTVAVHNLTRIPYSWHHYWLSGADYFVLYGQPYLWIAELVFLLAVSSMVFRLVSHTKSAFTLAHPWFYLYVDSPPNGAGKRDSTGNCQNAPTP